MKCNEISHCLARQFLHLSFFFLDCFFGLATLNKQQSMRRRPIAPISFRTVDEDDYDRHAGRELGNSLDQIILWL